jgi:D-alanine-D-alanine ligase
LSTKLDLKKIAALVAATAEAKQAGKTHQSLIAMAISGHDCGISIMKKTQKHIEIVRSTNKSLSSLSQKSCDAIYALLRQYYTKVGVTTVNVPADLNLLVLKQPDLVFMGMKFVPKTSDQDLHKSAKIWVADFLDAHNIAYTGSDQTAHLLELNKPLAKQRMLDRGLATSPFQVVSQNQLPIADINSLKFPLFIKPTNLGGGTGIDSDSVIYNFEQLQSKAQSIITDFKTEALIEQYLPGREFSVAILKDHYSDTYSAMPIELVAQPDKHGLRLLSHYIKSSDGERVVGIADRDMKTKVSTFALDAFHALGARDYGRIDIRLDANGEPNFLEANLIPGLIAGGYGYFPLACVLNRSMDYKTMILHIVNLGLARTFKTLDVETLPVLLKTPLMI